MAGQRYPLVDDYSEREPASASDQRLKNCYVETLGTTKDDIERWVVKRPGLAANDTTAVATGRGMYEWNGNVYAFVGNTVYKDGVSIGTIATATGRVYIDEAADGTGLLVVHDGANFYTIDSADTITTFNNGGDANIPATILPGIIVLDQFLFLGTNDVNNEIHNSAVGDIGTWNGDFITSEVRSDPGVAIARYINYIAAFNEDTTEFFFDAANATGTPLSKFEGMVSLIGCAGGETVTNVDQKLFWAAKSPDGGRFVAMLDGSFTPQRVSTQAIDEYLDKEGSNLSNAGGMHLRHAGHSLYALSLPTTADKTFVYDVDENLWYEWSSDVSATETHFTGFASTELNGDTLVLDEDNGRIYSFEAQTYQDNTGSAEDIVVEIQTKRFDNAVQLNKFCHRVAPIGDRAPGTATLNSSFSDDDYTTFATNRGLDLNVKDNFLTRFGVYKRRSWRLQYIANQPLRLVALECEESHGYYGR